MASKIVKCQSCGHRNVSKLSHCNKCGGVLDRGPNVNPWAKAETVAPAVIARAKGNHTTKQAAGPGKTKTCPMCGEEILTVAKKCKHCGSMLDGIESRLGSQTDLGMFLLATPIIGTTLILGWVGNMRLIDGPMNALGLITAAVVVITAIMAAVESSAAEATGRVERGATKPGVWLIGMILLWIVGYPWYMASRAKYGLPNRFLASLVCMAFLIAVGASITIAVEDQQSEIQRSLDDIQRSLDRY